MEPTQYLLKTQSTIKIPSSKAPLFLAITVATGKLVYNLYFHPLRSYPGPLLCRATVLYSLFWKFYGNSHIKTKEWHDKYGEVVRVSPDSLSYNSGRAWETICGHRTSSSQSLFDKDSSFFVEGPSGYHNIVGANGEHHRRLRRLLAHAFSEKALKAQEVVLQSYVDFFVSQLRDRASVVGGGVVNMTHWFNFTTFDIIGDLAFGDSFGLLERGIWAKYLSAIFGLLEFALYTRAIRQAFPQSWEKFLRRTITPKVHQEDRLYLYKVAQTKLKNRTSVNTNREDFVYHMLKGSKEAIGPDGLSFDEMITQSQLLLVAGSETTATALSGMLYHLLNKPSSLSRLINEIRSSFNSEKEITLQNTPKLRYLHAVLEETLRIYPPVPIAVPRITPSPGQMICDRFVPAGTSVGTHHYATYHSSQNFFDPDAFHPERWLGEDPRFANDQKSALHAFSHGPRNCLGKNLAYAELRLIICKFFWNFDVELMPESNDWDKQSTSTLWMKKPLMVKLLPRPVY